MLPGIAPIMIGGALVEISQTATGDSVIINGVNGQIANAILGEPAAGRRIYVVLTGYTIGSASITSLTISGVAASRRAAITNAINNDGFLRVEIWEALVPGGGTGNINYTYTSPISVFLAHTIFRVLPIANPAANIDVESANGSVLTTTLDVPDGGAVIAGHIRRTATQSVAWTGAIEQTDRDIDNIHRHSTAIEVVPGGQLGRSITGTASGSGFCAQCAVAIG